MGEIFKARKPAEQLRFTGERLTFDSRGQAVYEHIHRYFFAREFCRGRDVLDVASGEGFGAAYLAQTARSVVGVDISAEAVAHSNANYAGDNLRFQVGDATRLEFPDSSFDMVVSFETIEHLNDQETFVKEIRRVLRPGGLAVVSTPNRDIYSPANGPVNPFHVRELTRSEFVDALRAEFSSITLYGQRPMTGIALIEDRDDEEDKPAPRFTTFEKRDDDHFEFSKGLARPLYFLAVASAGHETLRFNSVYVETGDVDASIRFRAEADELQHLLQSINALHRAEAERRAEALDQLTAKHEELEREFDRVRIQAATRREELERQLEHAQVEGAARHEQLEREFQRVELEGAAKCEELKRQLERARIERDEAAARSIEAETRLGALALRARECSTPTSDEDGHATALRGQRDVALAGQLAAEERAAKLKLERTHVASIAAGLKLQLAELAEDRALLSRELSKAYHRPWRPIKHALNYGLLKVASGAMAPFSTRMRLRFRRSAQKRSPARFDRFLAPFEPQALMPPAAPFEDILLPEDTHRITVADISDLTLPTSQTPLVSIIIPCYGKALLTLQCLKSTADNPPAVPFEVLVVDDASGDPDIPLLGLVPGVRLVVNPQNLDFVRSCNRAAGLANGDYLFFLNNDTVLTGRWLEPLLEVFDHFPDAGCVGSKLLFPDGTLQEAGGIVWNDGSAWNYGRSDHPDKPQYNYVREADYVSGCAILIPRELWDKLGGFDELYAPAYCEDSDLAFRVRATGKKVYYCPFSVVVHLEGATNGTDVTTGAKAYQVANTDKFRDRWKETLARDQAPSGQDIMRARDRSLRRKTALVVDHYIPQPDQDAGSRTMIAMIEALLAAGYVVKFWPDNLHRDAEYTPILQGMGVEVLYGPMSFEQWIIENGEAISLALLSRPTVAPRYINLLRAEANAKIAYYGHDLHFQRISMEAERRGDVALAAEATAMEKTERSIFKQVDVVLYPSPEEAVVAEPEAKRAVSIQAYVYDDFKADRVPPKAREILFVAGFAHSPNVDAAVWLVREIFPLIQAGAPDATLVLVGANPTEQVRALASDRVKVTGRVSEEGLRASYLRARIAIVPLRFGAGVKSKVAESLREGLPLVTTSVGAQGLPGIENVASVADDPRTIADAALRLLEDDDLWRQTSARQVDYARQQFSRAAFNRVFLGAIQVEPVEGLGVGESREAEKEQA